MDGGYPRVETRRLWEMEQAANSMRVARFCAFGGCALCGLKSAQDIWSHLASPELQFGRNQNQGKLGFTGI